ncbi:MAG: ATP-binding protein [Kiloniellales bacterium]
MSKIVIVDDRVTNRRILTELAATIEADASVKAFADPVEALDWIKDNVPDLVVTDYKMPKLDGAEFIRRFRHLPGCFDVPVIVITIYEDREFRYKALEAGATDFLLSPVDHHEFRARSHNLLVLRRQQQIIKNRAYSLEQKLSQDHRLLGEILEESQERLRGVIDSVPGVIFACDVDQRLVFLNTGAGALARLGRDQAIGRTTSEVFPEPFDSESQQRDLRVLNDRAAIPAYESPMTDANGDERVMLVTKNPLGTNEGKVGLVVTAAIDITHRKHTEEALIEAKEQAELANRAKTEFLANMSHELRTPLNAIIGFAQVMSEEMMGPIGSPKYRNYTQDISQSAEHLLTIIDQILDLAKIETGRLELQEEETDLAATIAEATQIVRPRAVENQISFVVGSLNGLPRFLGDRTKIRQILTNLLSNAVKFTDPGGEISLSALVGPDRSVEIRVADTGIGMAPEEIPLALSRFGQIEESMTRRHPGAGLGLPLSIKLIELHGGTCQIDSKKGVGTTVTIRFPASRSLGSARRRR